MKRYVAAALEAVALVAAGCTSGQQASPTATTVASAKYDAMTLGRQACTSPVADTGQLEMFVNSAVTCDNGVRILVFTSNETRDNWANVAKQFGDIIVVGPLCAVTGEDQGLVDGIVAKMPK